MSEEKEYTPEETAETEYLTEEQKNLITQSLDKLDRLAQRQQGGRRTIGYEHFVKRDGKCYRFSGLGATESFGFNLGLIMMEGEDRNFIFSFARHGKEISINSKAGDFTFTPYGEIYGKEKSQSVPLPTDEFRKAIGIIEEEIKNPKGYHPREVFPG